MKIFTQSKLVTLSNRTLRSNPRPVGFTRASTNCFSPTMTSLLPSPPSSSSTFSPSTLPSSSEEEDFATTFRLDPNSRLGRVQAVFDHLESPSSIVFWPTLLVYLVSSLGVGLILIRDLLTMPYEETLTSPRFLCALVVWMFACKAKAKWETRKEWLKEEKEKAAGMALEEGRGEEEKVELEREKA